jgi:ribosomal protein S12 methylthiotransferase accessory factor
VATEGATEGATEAQGRVVMLAGSLRSLPLDEALPRARAAGGLVGVTRTTEITRLDRVGLPVCVAVRPTAVRGSTCVAAGKGFSLAEARVGALMEAVEQAWIEPGRAAVPVERVRVKDLLDGRDRPDAIVDLCPHWGSLIDVEAPTLAVRAHDLAGGDELLVPAELVFHPAPPHLGLGWFGSGSNGAASGADVAEATLHALVEVIERDALSFHNLRDGSVRVDPASFPPAVTEVAAGLEDLGLRLVVRALPNVLDLPAFTAILVDIDQPQLSIRGDGLHLGRELALQRAVSEAAQCRLTVIHGGRDDLDHFVVRFAAQTEDERARAGRELMAAIEAGPSCRFDDVPTRALPTGIDDALAALIAELGQAGFDRVLRVVLTPSDHPVQVVRVIVPGLECRLAETKRVGRRLRRFLAAPPPAPPPWATSSSTPAPR